MRIGLVSVFVFISLGLYIGVFCESACVERKVIASIGGCNRDAHCGVKYNDGQFGKEYFPVIGEQVCIQTILRRK